MITHTFVQLILFQFKFIYFHKLLIFLNESILIANMFHAGAAKASSCFWKWDAMKCVQRWLLHSLSAFQSPNKSGFTNNSSPCLAAQKWGEKNINQNLSLFVTEEEEEAKPLSHWMTTLLCSPWPVCVWIETKRKYMKHFCIFFSKKCFFFSVLISISSRYFPAFSICLL